MNFAPSPCPEWVHDFRRSLRNTRERDAYNALMVFARPEQLLGPLTARQYVDGWAVAWAATNSRRKPNTAAGYAALLRARLVAFAADREARHA